MGITRVITFVSCEGQGGIEKVSQRNYNSDIAFLVTASCRSKILKSQYGILFRLMYVIKAMSKYDVIVTNLPIHHMVLSILSLVKKKKHIAVEHGPWNIILYDRSISVKWIYEFWLRKTNSTLVCVSKDLYALYSLYKVRRLRYVPNMIRDKGFDFLETKLDKVCRSFVFIGRMDYQKNVTLTIQTIEKVMLFQQATLDLFGDGIELKKLKEEYQHSRNIRFHGYVRDLDNRLESYDALIITSRFEGLPGVVLEALSNRLMVFATPFIAGLLELNKSPNLIISDESSAESLAKAILDNNKGLNKCIDAYTKRTVERAYQQIFNS